MLIDPFQKGHEPLPVGIMFCGAGGIVLEAFKLASERGELLSQRDMFRDEIVVVHLLGLRFVRKAPDDGVVR